MANDPAFGATPSLGNARKLFRVSSLRPPLQEQIQSKRIRYAQ